MANIYGGETATKRQMCQDGIDLYGSRKAELPKPELYVILPGDRKDHPEV